MFGSLSRKLFKPLVPIIRLSGEINSTTTFLVSRSLSKIKPGRSDALGIVIDSNGGSPAQCEIILKKLQEFCHEHHLPLYTFAEGKALSSGYWMLSAGDKVYADNSSVIGNIGTSIVHTGIKDLAGRYNIETRTWTSDDKKIIPSIYSDVKDIQKEYLMKWGEYTRNNFVRHIEKYRESKIKVPERERDEKLYQGKVWTGKESLDHGLVDGLGTYASVFFREFPNSRIVDVSEKPTLEKYQDKAMTFVKLASSKALPWILAYFIIKGTIKLYLLLLVLGRKSSNDPKDQQEAKELKKVEESI